VLLRLLVDNAVLVADLLDCCLGLILFQRLFIDGLMLALFLVTILLKPIFLALLILGFFAAVPVLLNLLF
jgi:hypothetical protein